VIGWWIKDKLSLHTLALSLCLAVTSMAAPLDASAGSEYSSVNDKKRPANPYKLVSTEPFLVLAKKLKGQDGFVGGDSAYSIKLAPNKSLWLFDDSFIGKIVDGKRKNCKIVRNAIALDDQSKAGGKPTFYYHSDAFFRGRTKNIYWPGDGVMLNDRRLYLFAHEVESLERRPALHFNPYTDHLLVVQNPLADPNQWQCKDYRLGNRSSKRYIGIACLLDGDYLYIYCSNSAMAMGINQNPTSIARIKKTDLLALGVNETIANTTKSDQLQLDKRKMEWFAEGWHEDGAFLDILWEDGASEMTVTKLPGFPGFFVFYLHSGNKAILMRHADHPEGPWSKSISVYELPKTTTEICKNPARNIAGNISKDVVFYDAKAHTEYDQQKGAVVLTYCSSSKIFSRVLDDTRLYFPEAIKIKIAPAE
jgi:hypothetical protein